MTNLCIELINLLVEQIVTGRADDAKIKEMRLRLSVSLDRCMIDNQSAEEQKAILSALKRLSVANIA